MKKLLNNGLLSIIIILIISCSAKQEELILKSPEGNIEFKFKANRPSSLDPWNVTMIIAGYEKERSLTLDMYNSSFNAETVLVDWKNENSCIITLKQSDGDDRIMDVFLSEDEIKLQERGNENIN